MVGSREYSSSLSIVQITALGGFNIQSRPRTRRFALTGNVYLTRKTSLLLSVEDLRDDTINGQPWRLQIELTPAPASPIPPAGPGRRLRTQFRLVNGIWVYAAPVASIPVTALNETFTAVRQRVGDVLTVSILAKAKLKGVSAVVTAPDGATAGRKARG